MARLPVPGSDDGTWGNVLNTYLETEHNADGTHKATVNPDATTLAKGKIQLAGDLAGTAAAPTVPGLAAKADTGHTHAAGTLDSLSDVDTTTVAPTDEQALLFDTTTNLWRPGTVSSGGGTGLPAGGTANQVIIKQSATEGDALWQDLPAGPADALPIVNLPLTTLTGWTTHGGTWTAQADRISQSPSSGGTHVNLWLDASLGYALAEVIVECEIMMPAFGTTNPSRAGLILGPRTNNNNGLCIYFEANSTTSGMYRVYLENQGVIGRGAKNLTTAIPFGTFAKLRVEQLGYVLNIYVNDVFFFSHPAEWSRDADALARVGLASQGVATDYRNFKLWTPDPLKVGPRGLPGPQGDTLAGTTYIAIGPAQPADPAATPIWIKTGS